MHALTRTRLFIASALLGAFLGQAHAGARQEDPPTVELVNLALQQLEESTAADAPALKETYRKTLDTIQRTKAAAIRAAKYEAEASEAPALLAAIRKELAGPSAPVIFEELSDPTLDELVAKVDRSQAALEAARSAATDVESTTAKRAVRRTNIPGEIAQARQALATAEETLAATPNDAASAARRGLLLSEVAFQTGELEALAAERDTYAARSELLPLRRDRTTRDVVAAEQRYDHWRDKLRVFRQQDGESAANKAKDKLASVVQRFPELEPLAARNNELAARRSGEDSIPDQLASAQEALERDSALLKEITARYGSAKRRSELGSLSESSGFTLRRDYEWLPRETLLRTQATERAKALSEAELLALDFREQRALLSDTESAARAFLATTETDSRDALEEASSLFDVQRDSLSVVIEELGTLTDILLEGIQEGNSVQAAAVEYRSFIEQRILWVRSCRRGFLQSLKDAPDHAAAIARSIGGGQVGRDFRKAVGSRSVLCVLVLLGAVALIGGRRFLRGKREQMGKLTRSYKTDRYLYTVRALVQTLLLALPWPLLAWLAAKLLSDSTHELARAAGSALRETSMYWLTLGFLGSLLAEKGVGNVHFKWAPTRAAAVRRVLRWFTPIVVAFGFIALTLDRQSVTEWSDTLGRLSFLIAMGSLTFALHRLLRPESALWGSGLEKGGGLLSRTHRWWSFVATGGPLALIVLAFSGYYYTALQLELRTRYSLALALGLVLINALLLRWLFIARRRLAVSQALEARAKKDKEGEQAEEEFGEAAQAALDAEKVDIPAVDAQTRQLFRSSITLATVLGLFLIWSAALPALQGLQRVQILPYPAILATSNQTSPEVVGEVHVTDAVAAPEGLSTTQPFAPTVTAAEPSDGTGIPASLTLADVVLAAILTLLTTVAARNLPALLELALLQRLPLDGGSRYAVTTLLRYLIIMIGVSAVSGALGVGWKDIQWLVAALTFGLAFGLQEIFANFISGIIILIERPVRVGDIVTVGSTEGRVTRLRMRSTTILDWDRKEYLVPNKEFITTSVVNWTLSDPITRIIITVGIAYGSDTAKARSLLLKSAQKNALVVKDPKPTALFRRFGDSTLDFELRVFVENRDLWPQLIDKLHSDIDTAFRQADIEIAFPQRDLHIRSGGFAAQEPEDRSAPKPT